MPRGVSRTGRRVCLSAYTVPLPSLCSCLCVAGPCVAGMSTTKSVVVQCGAFNRIVSFSTAAPVGRTERELLCEAIRVAYSERIGPNDRLTLQVRSQEWDGMLIDFFKRHQSNCTSSLPSKQLSDNHPKDKQPEEEQEDYYRIYSNYSTTLMVEPAVKTNFFLFYLWTISIM